MEIEAKFAIPDWETLARLLGLTALGGYELRPAGKQELVDRYYDTPERAVGRGGYALRLRENKRKGRWRGTVKGLGSADGAVHEREEHEVELQGSLLPAEWPDCPARDVALRLMGAAALEELFAVEQRRVKREIWGNGGNEGYGKAGDSGEGGRLVGEWSVDEVRWVALSTAPAGGREARGLELEIELAEGGTLDDLEALTTALAGFGLRAEGRSKFERGLALIDSIPRHEDAKAGSGTKGEEEPLTAERAEGAEMKEEERHHEGTKDQGGRKGIEVEGNLTAEDAGRAEPVELAAAAGGATLGQRKVDDAESMGGATLGMQEGERAETQGEDGEGASNVDEPPAPRRAKSPGVRADEPMAEAGRKVLAFHFGRMVENEAGARQGEDIEAVHDMRVATRRQRAALRLFGGYFKPKAIRPFGRALREVAGHLGAVRDLDVLLDAARTYQAGLSEPAARAFQPVLEAWGRERDADRVVLLAHLDGEDYRRFKEKYAAFLATEGAGVAADDDTHAPALVRDLLPARLWEHYGAVRAYAPALPGAPVETLHALRIAGKRLRYALEFFAEALDPSLRQAIDAIVTLQDHLGALNDASVTLARLHSFLQNADPRPAPETVLAVGAYMRAQEGRVRQLRRSVGRPWRTIAGARFRRVLGRAVAQL
jgi:CHAD domain-containing protein